MASISREPGRSSWRLRWRDGQRPRVIRLGAMPRKVAESFLVRFEELLGVRRGGGSIPQALQSWLDSLPPDLRDKLADAGLVERREAVTLGRLCDAFRESLPNLSRASQIRFRQVCERLTEYFGSDRDVTTIGPRDAEAWRAHLSAEGNRRDKGRKTLEENTVRRRIGTAKQIFATAWRWKWIQDNPFDGLACSVRENLTRRAFVPWADVLRVIELAPGPEWRALLAFVRLTGCRVPSELQGLRWSDIDFESRRIVIRSPKTAHHGGEHALRSCPLFPELVPYLEAWRDVAGPGVELPLSAPVFPMVRTGAVNLRTQFQRLIVRAGLTPWPKLFVNLRSSRESELLAAFPAADVCRWMGHSPAIAARFYAQPRPEVAERAALVSTVATSASGGGVGGPHSGPQVGQIPGHSGSSAGASSNPHDAAQGAANRELVTAGGVPGGGSDGWPETRPVDTMGNEHRSKTREIRNSAGSGPPIGPHAGQTAVRDELRRLVEGLPDASLPAVLDAVRCVLRRPESEDG